MFGAASRRSSVSSAVFGGGAMLTLTGSSITDAVLGRAVSPSDRPGTAGAI